MSLQKEQARQVATPLMQLLREGALTQADWRKQGLSSSFDDFLLVTDACDIEKRASALELSWHCRTIITRECSWFIHTCEWLDSIAQLVCGKRVLEVCAGLGTLQPLMASRGVDWTCTDIEPRAHVEALDAFDLLELMSYKPDVVFAAWIPYTLPIDAVLLRTELPLIVVGESGGGCTGSGAFERAGVDCKNPKEVLPDFQDIPTWSAIHDHTILVNWR